MKVSFVNLKPLSNRGGAEKWISEVGHIIEDMGNEVEILVPSCENNIAEIAGFKHIFYKSELEKRNSFSRSSISPLKIKLL